MREQLNTTPEPDHSRDPERPVSPSLPNDLSLSTVSLTTLPTGIDPEAAIAFIAREAANAPGSFDRRRVYSLTNGAMQMRIALNLGRLSQAAYEAVEIIPRDRLDLPYNPPTDAHTLDEGDLLKAIPDHLGHGISGYISGERMREAMRYEGDTDRAQARILWRRMTEFWMEPTVEKLEAIISQVIYCGEWKDGIFELEISQRGPLVASLVDYGVVLADLGLIERRVNEESSPDNNRLLGHLLGLVRRV